MRSDGDRTLNGLEFEQTQIHIPPALLRYAFAVLAVFVSWAVRNSITPYLGHQAPFMLFAPAALVAAWYGRVGPGIFAMLFGLVLGHVFFASAEPAEISLRRTEEVLAVVYVLTTGVGVALLEALHRANRREWETSERARVRGEQLQREIEERKLMEETLKREKSFSDATVNSLPGIFYLVDDQGRFLRWNDNLESVTGYAPHELSKMYLMDLFRGADRKLVEERIRQVLARGESKFEAEVLTKDGSAAPYFLTGKRVERGTLPCLVGMGINVSDRRRAEEAVVASNRRIAHILESITDSFFAVDRQWRFTYVNEGAEIFFGKSRDQLLGQNYWETFPVVRGTEFEKQYRRALEEQVAVHFEIPSLHAPGTWLEVHAYPSADGLGVFFRDITPRKLSQDALRASEERLRVAVQNSPMSVFTQDRELRYTWLYNSHFSRNAEEIVGKRDEDLFSDRDLERIKRIKCEVLATGIGRRAEMKMTTLGRDWYFDLTVEPLKNSSGEVIGITGAVVDITDRKEVEMALRQTKEQLGHVNDELEKRVAERTVRLQETIKSLESFCYTIAHDLRSPLRAMRGFTTALLEDYASALDEKGQDYARRVRNAASKMDQLIDDLLEYGRLSHVDLPVIDLHLDLVLNKVLARLAEEAGERRAAIHVEQPLGRVQANPIALAMALSNLLTNAMKFVEAGTAPQIRIWTEERNDKVRILVQDNGIGIEPIHQERIFRIFERLHGAGTYPGTGIGLALVRKAAERMGGSVGVESEVGKGSRFWIELPSAGGRI